MKRIVIFHPAIAPYRIDFFNSLHRAFDVSFYFEHENPLEQNFNQEIINSQIEFSYSYLKPGLFGIKNLRWDVFKILRKEKPHIIFISEYTILGLLILLYKYLFNPKAKIVITCDDNLSMAVSARWIKRITRFVLLKTADLVLVVNDLVKSWYERNCFSKATFFYFPIIQSDTIFRTKLQKAFPLTENLYSDYKIAGKKVLLYVGRLAPVKNIPFLIDVFEQLYVEQKDIVLFLVGDGPERTYLEEKIQQSEAKQSIYLVGKKEGIDLMAYYNLADLFVLPSTYEPFGTVVNEALLAGCYTFCSSVAGAACLIKEAENGDVFDPYNVKELTYKLDEYLSKIEPLKQISLKPNRMDKEYSVYMKDLLTKLNTL